MFFNRTKIICTIGPSVNTLEKMLELIEAGMNVARVNFSHGTHEQHRKTIDLLKKARAIAKRPMAIMLDTKGPEVRVGALKEGGIEVACNQKLKIVEHPKAKNEITIHPFDVLQTVTVGMKILFDDGYIISHVIEKEDHQVIVEIENRGILKSSKGVNIPSAHLNLPAMTPRDIEDLKFGCKNDIDIVAASFIRSSHHVLAIKDLLNQEGKGEVLVIAKIENSQGVENFDSIVQVADGVMIARGDLGVELDLGQVPKLQKMMIRKCYQACKPVVIATQMLESMIQNPRPTRAEVSDIANAVYESTSAVMLSGETAVGKYPIETVERMKSIIRQAEEDFDYREFFYAHSKRDYHDVSSSVALAAVKTAYSANAKAIFAFTSSGFTARLVSRLRPEMPIIAMTGREKNYNQLAFNWGIVPVLAQCKDSLEAFKICCDYALKNHHINFGDLVIVTAGSPFGKTGSTNMMKVENIGDVLVRGQKGFGPKIEGEVSIILSPVDKDPMSVQEKLLVVPRCDNTFLPLVKYASGLIVENHIDDVVSEKYAILIAKTFDISVIVRADGAMCALKEGQKVTLDPGRGLVYRGMEELGLKRD